LAYSLSKSEVISAKSSWTTTRRRIDDNLVEVANKKRLANRAGLLKLKEKKKPRRSCSGSAVIQGHKFPFKNTDYKTPIRHTKTFKCGSSLLSIAAISHSNQNDRRWTLQGEEEPHKTS
jgi:hypothetical protein